MKSNFWKFILHFYSHELTILQFPFLVFFNLKNPLRSSYLIVINHFTNNILHFSIINNIINHHICKFHLWYYNSLSWNINYFYLDFNSNLKNETTITHLKKKKKKEEKRSENGRGLISFDASHSEILKQKSGRLKPRKELPLIYGGRGASSKLGLPFVPVWRWNCELLERGYRKIDKRCRLVQRWG